MKYLLFITVMLMIVFPAWSQSEGILNQLLAPGPLMQGHANLEGKDCLKCHEAGKGVSIQRCMDCHKQIKQQLASKKGFHSIAMQSQSCINCHSDHKGREFDSTKIVTKSFDHLAKTNFDLKGKHSELKCEECHTEKRSQMMTRKNDIRFIAKPSTCVSCHKKDDIHFYKGEFEKKDCNACHSNNSWKQEIKFNHNLDTKFKLVEKHADLKCNNCHNIDVKKKIFQYQWPQLAASQCLSCHADFHKNNLSIKNSGGKCTTCHTQTKWSITDFNHALTGFKLKGKHEVAKCIDCHKPNEKVLKTKAVLTKNLNFTGLKQNCTSCHADFHKFGSSEKFKFKGVDSCLKCHEESSWKKTHGFEHAKNTGYVIDGMHKELKCSQCHLPSAEPIKNLIKLLAPTYQWKHLEQKTCESCHSSPHINEFSKEMQTKKCSSCHTTEGWYSQKAGGFDHSKTRFNLTGIHSSTKCSDCHGPTGKQIFKFKSVENKFCIDCHTNIHTGQFKTKLNLNNCSECHNTTNFKTDILFNHSQTGFNLTGKHKSLTCTECHIKTSDNYKIKWPNFILKNTVLTKQSEIISPKSKFVFNELKAKQCLACHQDFHMGQLGNNCNSCHSDNGWKPAAFDHNQQSQFILKGKHQDLKCSECHKPTDKITLLNKKNVFVTLYKPMVKNCVQCHQDYHVGQLGNNCKQCHNEESWKKTSFVHNINSSFKLFNKHAEAKCQDCHKPSEQKITFQNKIKFVMKYKPMGASCVECHNDAHKGSFGKKCSECHSDRDWKSTKDFHKNFTLTGVHYTLSCVECHKDSKKLAGLSQNCLACHQKDDVHNGSLPNCKSCHNQQFWDTSMFKHAMTRFPLRGAHRVIECTDCHRNGLYKGLSSNCIACHLSGFQANPVPHTSGNTNCTDCHRNTFTFGSAN